MVAELPSRYLTDLHGVVRGCVSIDEVRKWSVRGSRWAQLSVLPPCPLSA